MFLSLHLFYKKCFLLSLIGYDLTVKEKEVIAWLSERKLMPSPELITHVVNHPEGLVLLEKSIESLDGPKLFLSVSDLLVDETPEPLSQSVGLKLQTSLLL